MARNINMKTFGAIASRKIGTQCVHVSAIWKLLLDMLFCLTLYKMLASLVLYGVMFVSQL